MIPQWALDGRCSFGCALEQVLIGAGIVIGGLLIVASAPGWVTLVIGGVTVTADTAG